MKRKVLLKDVKAGQEFVFCGDKHLAVENICSYADGLRKQFPLHSNSFVCLKTGTDRPNLHMYSKDVLVEIEDNRNTVAIDLDGVLAQYDGWKGVDVIGDPIPGAKEFVAEISKFARVLIYTTRCAIGDQLERDKKYPIDQLVNKVVEWLVNHDIPFDEVYAGQGKPLAAAYVDDRAVRCDPQNTDNKLRPLVFSVALGRVKNLVDIAK